MEETKGASFKPLISSKSKKIKRNKPIDTLLYEDAMRRQEKHESVERFSKSKSAINISLQNGEVVPISKPFSMKSEQYAA